MKEKGLIRINGQLQQNIPQVQRKRVHNDDIPDYDTIKDKANPMEAIVQKLEEQGYTAQQAFDAFDWDGDEVLTISEIKDGMQANKISLLDSEWNQLVAAIDLNHDGVLTCEEWVKVLEPKIVGQRGFSDLMKGIDLNDPIDLEERILDIQFRKRRLDNEVRQMRRQKQSDLYFKNQKAKDEQKVVSDRIKELELQVKDNKFKQEEAQLDFAAKLSKGP